MGDRANIVVHETVENKDATVFLYTHWGGYKIKETLQKALARKQRWDDPAYLTRIIFCEMVKKDVDGETGYGISTTMCDNEHNLLHVHPAQKIVKEVTEDGKMVKSWTFEQYIKADLTPKDEEE